MAFFWVQQWFALPLVVDDPMGDIPEEAALPALDSARPGAPQDEAYLNPKKPGPAAMSANAPFQAQYSSLHPSPQQSLEVQRPSQQSCAYGYPMASAQAPSPFNMAAMAGSLPDYAGLSGHNPPQQNHQPQRALSGASTSALVYQLQQISQYPGQAAAAGYVHQPAYGTTFSPAQYPQSYAPYASGQQRPGGHGQMAQSYSPYPIQAPQYMYYPSPYGPQSSMAHPSMAYTGSHMDNDGRRASVPSAQGAVSGSSFQGMDDTGAVAPVGSAFVQGMPRMASDAGLNAMPRGPPRGPPRKPKQSGHALWVGNLPPGTTVIDLKDHFSRDATKDIESLFLISKSNCAFVNYRTEASCSAAMHRFHDSRFNGVRLVCRLRRSSTPAPGVPTGPSAMSASVPPSNSSPPPAVSPDHQEVADGAVEQVEQPLTDGVEADAVSAPKVPEKFFVVKSLTLQDLELSVRNGIWATQAHNEEALNKAYEAADNVYLIFSANKSGEYFGYARMTSPISEDAAEIMRSIPEPEAPESSDAPKSIPTPATGHAPRGRIIDDSARGTIFWEADLPDADGVAPSVDGSVQATGAAGDMSAGTSQIWGKPFKIEWVSTNRLPFYRTRGLRNPWNANREVKIARDGTELETSVGQRLIQMFHRLGPPNAGPPGVSPSMHMPGPPGPPMRPY